MRLNAAASLSSFLFLILLWMTPNIPSVVLWTVLPRQPLFTFGFHSVAVTGVKKWVSLALAWGCNLCRWYVARCSVPTLLANYSIYFGSIEFEFLQASLYFYNLHMSMCSFSCLHVLFYVIFSNFIFILTTLHHCNIFINLNANISILLQYI